MGLVTGAVGAGAGLAGSVGKGVWSMGGWARGAMIGGAVGGVYGGLNRGRGQSRLESIGVGAAWGAGIGAVGGALVGRGATAAGRGISSVRSKIASRGGSAAAEVAAPVAAAVGGTASAAARSTAKSQKYNLMRRIRDSVQYSPAVGYATSNIATGARGAANRVRNAFRPPLATPMSAELGPGVSNAGTPMSRLPFSTKGPAGAGAPLPAASSFRKQDLAAARRQARIAEFKRTGAPPKGWMAELNRTRGW